MDYTDYTDFLYFCRLMSIILIVLAYFAILFGISHLTSRRADNQTFYRANRRAPWYMVAFGMVGASISGVTFVSVPGMVLTSQMTYLQMCLSSIPKPAQAPQIPSGCSMSALLA